MRSIGSRTIARQALDTDIPARGWRKIGTGSFRTALLHIPTDVVYKVESSGYSNKGYGNDDEYRNARRLYRRFATPVNGVRIPLVSRYRFADATVLAMEYVRGKHLDVYDEGDRAPYRDALRTLFLMSFHDMHGLNFIVQDDDVIVPIDMASPRSVAEADTRCLDAADPKAHDILHRRRHHSYGGCPPLCPRRK